jgi:hypothetical protein
VSPRALEGHEVCSRTAVQATSTNSLTNRLPPERAEWVRFLVALGSQGQRQESIHPNAYGQHALGQCLTLVSRQPVGDYDCRNTPGKGPEAMRLESLA